jgi:hypothetical protein
MKCKRGSHVGIVLSFIIFVTFMFFLYTTLEPAIKIKEDKQFILNYLEIELIGKLSGSLTSITLVIGKDVNQDCIELENFLDKELINKKLIVKNNLEEVLESKSLEESLFVDRGDDQVDFFKIRVSEEFEEIEEGEMENCKELKEDNEGYKIGSIKSNKYLFETRIIELKENYVSDYDSIKKELNISTGNEFGFDFIYNNGTVVGTEIGETKRDIYIEEIPVQYVDKEANILPGVIRIKVW